MNTNWGKFLKIVSNHKIIRLFATNDKGVVVKNEEIHLAVGEKGDIIVFREEDFCELVTEDYVFDDETLFLYNEKNQEYEVMVFSPRTECDNVDSQKDHYTENIFAISEVSISYKIEMIFAFIENGVIDDVFQFNRRNSRYYKLENITLASFIDYIYASFRNASTKSIKVTLKLLPKDGNIHNLVNSFIYNYSLTTRVSYSLPKPNIIFQKRDVFSQKLKPIADIDMFIPHRKYDAESIDKYVMAKNESDPFISFILFYHILERKFLDVYNEDFANSLIKLFTDPKLPFTNKKNALAVASKIRNDWIDNEDGGMRGSEKKSLTLLLENTIENRQQFIDELKIRCSFYDYYMTTAVPFSGGGPIKEKNFYSSLSSRIYETRNALVHNSSALKKGKISELRYNMDTDAGALKKEIPLLALVAEYFILAYSKEIKYPEIK